MSGRGLKYFSGLSPGCDDDSKVRATDSSNFKPRWSITTEPKEHQNEREPKKEKPIKITRVYAEQGKRLFGELETERKSDFAPPPPLISSPWFPAGQRQRMTQPPGGVGEWHFAPRRFLFCILSGGFGVESGERREFPAGELVLVEDKPGGGGESPKIFLSPLPGVFIVCRGRFQFESFLPIGGSRPDPASESHLAGSAAGAERPGPLSKGDDMATTAEELNSGAQAVDIDNRIVKATPGGQSKAFPAQQQGREVQRLTRMERT